LECPIAEDFSRILVKVHNADFKAPDSLPLWERYSREVLIDKASGMSRAAVRRGYFLNPFSEEERLMSEFDLACRLGRGLRVSDLLAPEESKDWPRFSAMDPGGSSRPGTALITIARRPDGVRFPVDIEFGQWPPKYGAERAVLHHDRNRPGIFKVENNALQDAFIELIRALGGPDIPLSGFYTGKNKADPDYGVGSLDAEFGNGGWIFPMGEVEGHTVDCGCPWCRLKNELYYYPNYATTDGVMALWFAREAARTCGKPAAGKSDGKPRQRGEHRERDWRRDRQMDRRRMF
jgi:hypothetical protein